MTGNSKPLEGVFSSNPAVPTASRQLTGPVNDTQPDILRIYPLLKEP